MVVLLMIVDTRYSLYSSQGSRLFSRVGGGLIFLADIVWGEVALQRSPALPLRCELNFCRHTFKNFPDTLKIFADIPKKWGGGLAHISPLEGHVIAKYIVSVIFSNIWLILQQLLVAFGWVE